MPSYVLHFLSEVSFRVKKNWEKVDSRLINKEVLKGVGLEVLKGVRRIRSIWAVLNLTSERNVLRGDILSPWTSSISARTIEPHSLHVGYFSHLTDSRDEPRIHKMKLCHKDLAPTLSNLFLVIKKNPSSF